MDAISSLEAILSVSNVMALSRPLVAIVSLLTARKNPHTIIKEWIGLSMVQKIQFVSASLLARDFEEEPLYITMRVRVILQDQIIFCWVHLNYSCQVPTLKLGVKLQQACFMARYIHFFRFSLLGYKAIQRYLRTS